MMQPDAMRTIKDILVNGFKSLKNYSGRVLGVVATSLFLLCTFVFWVMFSFYAQVSLIFNSEDSSLGVVGCLGTLLFIAFVASRLKG
jgi:hypothetical protein